MRARLVLGTLGAQILRKGEEPKVSRSFNRAVGQAILLYVS